MGTAYELLAAFRDAANDARGHYGIEQCSGPTEPSTEWDEIQERLTQLAREADELLMPGAAREPSIIKEGGYQGSSDPGRPTQLMQQQTRSVSTQKTMSTGAGLTVLRWVRIPRSR